MDSCGARCELFVSRWEWCAGVGGTELDDSACMHARIPLDFGLAGTIVISGRVGAVCLMDWLIGSQTLEHGLLCLASTFQDGWVTVRIELRL